ncbi:hypothetical protein NDN08_006696 [Rhodosorus marinus]|uniref:Vps41 beta-propeller domain-containing protein n=1 Tax=Rhodosorus marinus TaxID=101924 RepID=A0AAV8UJU0_9RHOD|nr:hypothetical protein NDN08_006696 [Rhodosorus marinus]
MYEDEPAFSTESLWELPVEFGSVACVSCSTRFIAVGTTRGDVFVLDILGNEINRLLALHKSRITGLCFASGCFSDDVIASVDRDDRMLIVSSSVRGASSIVQEIRTRIQGSSKLNGVAVDPHIDTAAQGKRFAIACSDGKLQIFTSSWLIGSHSTLREGEGEIQSVCWEGNLLAWSTTSRIRVFDMTNNYGVCMIMHSDNVVPKPVRSTGQGSETMMRPKLKTRVSMRKAAADELYSLCLTSNDTVKAYTVNPDRGSKRKVVLKNSYGRNHFSRDKGNFPENASAFPFLGSVYFSDDEIALLLASELSSGLELSHLSVYDNSRVTTMDIQSEGDRLMAGIVPVPGSEAMALIYQAQTIKSAEPRSIGDRLEWLIEKERYEEAIDLVGSTERSALLHMEDKVSVVGEKFLLSLLGSQEWQKLSDLLPRVLQITTLPETTKGVGNESSTKRLIERWTQWIKQFVRAGKTAFIVDVIPLKTLRLPKEEYTRILSDLTARDQEVLVKVLGTWDSSVFDVPTVTRIVETELKTAQNKKYLKEALLVLYDYSHRHDKTLRMLLRDRSSRVFDYISNHELFEAVREKESIQTLYSIDENSTSRLLAREADSSLPSTAVVSILEDIGDRKLLFSYLHTLFNINPDHINQHHKALLELYCAFGSPGSLIRFLKSSHYSLENALETIKSAAQKTPGKDFSKEIVFVLQRMGDLVAALEVLLDDSKDVEGAIEFAKEQADPELWKRLLDRADDAEVLSRLLDDPHESIDSVLLFEKINASTRVPDLTRKLFRLVANAKLERELREICMEMLSEDVGHGMNELDQLVRKPV